jgi:hypothetical protein
VVLQLVLILQPIEGVGFQLTGLARTHGVSSSCGTGIIFNGWGSITVHVEGWRRDGKSIGQGGKLL